MTHAFQANGLATLIGSLPMVDHGQAIDLILAYTPEIPLWPQLPNNKEEGMMVQFANQLPGFSIEKGSGILNTAEATFNDELLKFYEDYMAVIDGNIDLEASRFALKKDTAGGFFSLQERLAQLPAGLVAIKGQITQPCTQRTGIVDQDKRAIFYDIQLRDAAVKLLAMQARWQVRRLAEFKRPVIIFVDEPGLAGFGSSEFTSISRDDVGQCLEEIFEAVHLEGGLAGIHVCANTDWSLVLESSTDIVSFDAYAYFDRFILYRAAIKNFLDSGKILAWGMVPTLNADEIERETGATLLRRWLENVKQIEALGVHRQKLINQSLITPSCGVGSLDLDSARKVLTLTAEVSGMVRKLKFSA